MKDFIIDCDYGLWIGTPFSSNVNDQCIYAHWDCWGEHEDEYWFNRNFKSRWGVDLGFLDFIYYALLHEELHLVLYRLGEEDYKIEGKENIFHSELMSRVLVATIRNIISFYKQHKLDRWF